MMSKNSFPIQLFIVLEKVNINFWTNSLSNKNLFFIFIKKNWIILFSQILKNELFLNNLTLIESSFVDFNSYFLKNLYFLKFKGLLFFNFYVYQLKLKLIIFSFNNNYFQSFPSLDKIFLNSDWLEREVSEMYNLKFVFKNDTRNLLLEYSKKEGVMLKEFQLEGFHDVFYSFFENQVVLKKNFLVEL